MAGLAAVPVIVRELDDQSALAVALIENLQREDLNPLDQARSLARLASEFELTHEEVARAVGRSRAGVSNLLRLLDLQDEVKKMLADGRIQMGHARALLPLDAKRQVALARRCSRKGFSVRQVEDRVRRHLDGAAADKPEKPPTDLQTRWLQTQLRAELGPNVSIRPARDGGYGLNLAFDDLAELESSLEKLLDLLKKVRSAAGPRARESAP
jgi:ParB family chromosome partitioning protein